MTDNTLNIVFNSIDIGYSKSLIQNINTEIVAGQLIGLIGENGVGKSTLLKTFARFIKPIQGEILINELDIQKYNQQDFAKILSIVTTQRVNISHFTIEEVVAFGRYPHGNWHKNLNNEDEDIVQSAINEVKAKHLMGKYINEISDGEYQRVMIARCLAQNTPIILLDEPTAFLDFNGKYEIINLLQRLAQKQNKLIIFSSHDLSLAIKYVSKIWLIQHKKLIEETPEDLILHHKINDIIKTPLLSFNPYTGDFDSQYSYHKKISLKGDELAQKWTKNALNKIGYDVTNESNYPSLTIKIEENYYKWIYKENNELEEMQFNSVNDLTLYLKSLTKN